MPQSKRRSVPIPTRIRVGDRMYSVEIVETMRSKLGHIIYGTQLIKVAQRSSIDKRVLTSAQMQQTFWHELTHAILYDMDTPLYKDEAFVDAFATRLAAAINSAKFD